VTRAKHCSSLDDSLALAVALLVDESLSAAAAESAKADATTRPLPTTEQPLGAPANATPQRVVIPPETLAPREPWRAAVYAGPRSAIGLLPGFGFAVAAGASLEPPRWPQVLAEAEYFLRQQTRRDDGMAGARFGLFRASVLLCPALSMTGEHRVELCAGQVLGRMHVRGFGYDRNLEDARLTYALSARVELTSSFSALLIRALIGVELPFTRDRFVGRSAGDGELFRAAPVALIAGISAGLHLQ
jgi:hypothetical protein